MKRVVVDMGFDIRQCIAADAPQIAVLFFDTIHSVNLGDYTQEQVDAWAPPVSGCELTERIAHFSRSLETSLSYVADREGMVIGFANIMETGHLDWMYVHKDYQRQGVASGLLKKLEKEALQIGLKAIWADVSITAQPFFARHGYQTVQKQTVTVRNVSMNNFKMTKTL